jgi:hypothetical protein
VGKENGTEAVVLLPHGRLFGRHYSLLSAANQRIVSCTPYFSATSSPKFRPQKNPARGARSYFGLCISRNHHINTVVLVW